MAKWRRAGRAPIPPRSRRRATPTSKTILPGWTTFTKPRFSDIVGETPAPSRRGPESYQYRVKLERRGPAGPNHPPGFFSRWPSGWSCAGPAVRQARTAAREQARRRKQQGFDLDSGAGRRERSRTRENARWGPGRPESCRQRNRGLDQDRRGGAGCHGAKGNAGGPLLLTYTISQADEKGPFLPLPADVQEKAKMKWLGFETPEEGLGERFHGSSKLLAELNPGKKLDTAGEQIAVPNVRRTAGRMALRVVVSRSKRTVIAYGAGGKELAQYPATIGDSHDQLPIGHWTVTGVVHYPWYNYDPDHFLNSDPKQAKAVLPPEIGRASC